jgi:hypothetical protein
MSQPGDRQGLPRHDDPYEDIVVELHTATISAVAEALAEAAEWASREGDRETARTLAQVADVIEAASVTPAEADHAGLSRSAAWHPASIIQRAATAAIENAARYLDPSEIASQAIQTAAAIAWSVGGQEAKDEVLEHCRRAIENAAAENYPASPGPRPAGDDPAPSLTPARAARRRRLGLPAPADGDGP